MDNLAEYNLKIVPNNIHKLSGIYLKNLAELFIMVLRQQ